jgi:SanA protein
MGKLRRLLIILLLGVCVVFLFTNVWIVRSTRNKVYEDISQLPSGRVALVLGTSHRTTRGGPNPFFEKRMETALALYRHGKVSHFILSGDNSSRYYNEPKEMKKALIKLGVPESAITLDYAGLRTLDSIVRSKEIFGQQSITIITQPFHSYRALFISDFYDIDAVAMVAAEPAFGDTPSVRVREYFARAKAVLDLYVLRTGPLFLGRKEEITIQP